MNSFPWTQEGRVEEGGVRENIQRTATINFAAVSHILVLTAGWK